MRNMLHNLAWTEGLVPLGIIACIGLGAWYFQSRVLGIIALALLLFTLYFFRNPERICPEAQHDKTLLICPADGKILEIVPVEDPFVGSAWKISIFLSPLDVHVQWTPQSGVIGDVAYRAGKFAVAYAPKASEVNERNDITLVTERGIRCRVRQIAGFVARRIVCWVRRGDACTAGEKYGMIRFGSRVELFVPRETHLHVEEGQRVCGGATIIGRVL